MSSETTSESSEMLGYDPSKYDWMPVREAIIQEKVSEKSIYNRIKSDFYKSRKENGNTIVGVPRKSANASEPVSVVVQGITEEDSEEFTKPSGQLLNRPSEGASEKLIDFMQNTMDRMIELSREAERYKLLTDTSTRTARNLEEEIEELKAAVFERDAQIKSLEQSGPDHELSARVKQLEAALTEKESRISELSNSLESERKKSGWAKLIGK